MNRKRKQGEKRKRGAGFLRRTGPKLSLTSSSNRVQKDKNGVGRVSHCFFSYYHQEYLSGSEENWQGKTSHSVEP